MKKVDFPNYIYIENDRYELTGIDGQSCDECALQYHFDGSCRCVCRRCEGLGVFKKVT